MIIFCNGLQRSGTNYVKQVLEESNRVTVFDKDGLYHKHQSYNGTVPVCDKIVTVIKNPYQWIESVMFRHPADIKEFYPNILNSSTSNPFVNFDMDLFKVCKLYKDYYIGWLKAGIILVHYEDMLNRDFVEDWCQQHFSDYFEHARIPDFVHYTGTLPQDRIKAYTDFKLSLMPVDWIAKINDCLSDVFLSKVGYTRIL